MKRWHFLSALIHYYIVLSSAGCVTRYYSAKSDRMRIIFELAEADVCQHIEEIRQMVRLLRGVGCKVMASQAGLTVVSTSY